MFDVHADKYGPDSNAFAFDSVAAHLHLHLHLIQMLCICFYMLVIFWTSVQMGVMLNITHLHLIRLLHLHLNAPACVWAQAWCTGLHYYGVKRSGWGAWSSLVEMCYLNLYGSLIVAILPDSEFQHFIVLWNISELVCFPHTVCRFWRRVACSLGRVCSSMVEHAFSCQSTRVKSSPIRTPSCWTHRFVFAGRMKRTMICRGWLPFVLPMRCGCSIVWPEWPSLLRNSVIDNFRAFGYATIGRVSHSFTSHGVYDGCGSKNVGCAENSYVLNDRLSTHLMWTCDPANDQNEVDWQHGNLYWSDDSIVNADGRVDSHNWHDESRWYGTAGKIKCKRYNDNFDFHSLLMPDVTVSHLYLV